jgi:hypothetical protein
VLFPVGEFIETKHFSDEMANEGFDRNDLRRLAQGGRIVGRPDWDARHRAWKWRIEGVTVEGRRLVVIFNVLGPHRVRGITALRLGSRR